jgi:hypothetical protein
MPGAVILLLGYVSGVWDGIVIAQAQAAASWPPAVLIEARDRIGKLPAPDHRNVMRYQAAHVALDKRRGEG